MSKEKIYVSGSTSDRPRVRDFVAKLRAKGFIVTSRWHDDDIEARDFSFEERAKVALPNWEDLEAANVFVLLTVNRPQRGCHAEFGYALKAGQAMHVIGNFEELNTMCSIPAVHWWRHTADFLASCV